MYKMETGCVGEAQKSDRSSYHGVRSAPNQASSSCWLQGGSQDMIVHAVQWSLHTL